MNYLGNIYTKLFDVLKRQDGLSMGEKLFSIEKEVVASFILANDQEIYEAIERYLNHPIEESDEPMEDSEFNNWVESKFEEQE